MRLYEYQGMELFRKYHIPVAPGFLITNLKELKNKNPNRSKPRGIFNLNWELIMPQQAAGYYTQLRNKKIPQEVVVKAQVLVGKRKKHGLIQRANSENVMEVCKNLFDKKTDYPIKKLWIAQMENILREYYAALTIDRITKKYIFLFSKKGGIDIEELAQKSPRDILTFSFFSLKELLMLFNEKIKLKKSEGGIKKQLRKIIQNMFTLMQQKDCTLVEINPLILNEKQRLIAADAKIIIDDNALYRRDFPQQEEYKTILEQEAAIQGLAYVELDGDIAVIGNGAGLVMASLDTISHFGGKPASFCDIGGGTGADVMEKALDISLRKRVKGLLINIFAGITHCDQIAEGIVHYKKRKNIKIPVVVRMIGTFEEKGKAILEQAGIQVMNNMEKAAENIVQVSTNDKSITRKGK